MQKQILDNQLEASNLYRLVHPRESFEPVSASYLLIDESSQGKSAVLFDPGPALPADWLVQKLLGLLKPHELHYLVIQQPQAAHSGIIPLLTRHFPVCIVIVQPSAAVAAPGCSFHQPLVFPARQDYRLLLPSGRSLLFLPIPGIGSPGALATYDAKSRTLLSGALFSAYTNRTDPAVAGDYLPAVDIWHGQQVQATDDLRSALLRVQELQQQSGLDLILPVIGQPLSGQLIAQATARLAELECGHTLPSLRRELYLPTYGYLEVYHAIYELAIASFGSAAWQEALRQADWPLDQFTLAERASAPWLDQLLAICLELGGYAMLDLWARRLLPLVNAHGLTTPAIFQPALPDATAGQWFLATQAVTELRLALMEAVNNPLAALQTAATLSPTQLDNLTELSTLDYLPEFLALALRRLETGTFHCLHLALIGVDAISAINQEHGLAVGDRVLKKVAQQMAANCQTNCRLFRNRGASIIAVIWDEDQASLLERIEQCRQNIAEQNFEQVNATVSCALLCLTANELPNLDQAVALSALSQLLGSLQSQGGNRVGVAGMKAPVSETGSILIVDPNPVSTRVLTSTVSSMGFTVRTAADGLEALQLLDSFLPTLILSEVLLPKRGGQFLLTHLRQNSALMDIPLIFVTALADPEQELRALRAGAADYLQKPIHPDVLRVRIQRILADRETT